ncbi:hypothetical protein NCCP1664_04360 [Zafaria cholistanensis]|uniref:Uncharacterized protein n=1 Tax=Zafaria cholistanensis TaxID=1682741 RepID=A0A5A7NMZ8_9MICC|nr:glycosyltransferase family A protein [Zafaria cholistanensis]GER21939.1 hypothetical protein NCCP1664_04360 [Zafaria cholistanensis]
MEFARRVRIVRRQALDRYRSLARRPHPAGDSGESSSADTALVSVVVPVHNAMPYLAELLESLENQDMDRQLFEVIAVDDGSTDAGGRVLEDFAARNPNARVIHQPNSGWPGKPRNVGVAASRAEFVFFCDADDVLGPEALRRMVDYARQHGVDVLLPKLVGLGGRGVREALFEKTLLDAPLRTAAVSLAPQKLIRRRLLVDNGIRFPEGKVRLEDGIVVSQCYLRSRRTSVLADYDYYQLRRRDDGGNISSRPVVPEDYVRSVTRIAEIFAQGAPDPRTAGLLVLDLYRRKCLRFYEPRRFARFRRPVQRRWVLAHAAFVERFITPDLQRQLGEANRRKTELILARDAAGMAAYCASEARGR